MAVNRRHVLAAVTLLGTAAAGIMTRRYDRPPKPEAVAPDRRRGPTAAANVPNESDLIVIGAGAAGLTAALTAADRGATVTVLEATPLVGGTTAFSGGLLWAPFNKFARAAGIVDRRDIAEAYVQECLGSRARDPRWAVFFDFINGIVDFLESRAGIRFLLTRYPDAFAERPSGRDCRHINIAPFDLSLLGEWRGILRRPPGNLTLLTIPDIEASTRPMSVYDAAGMAKLAAIAAKRTLAGEVTMGYALVAALLKACLLRNVQVRTGRRVSELVVANGRVSGVVVRGDEGDLRLTARRSVVLACGGFDWSEELKRRYLPGPIEATQTPPLNIGANLLLGESVGAALRATEEAWYLPGVIAPGARPYEGKLIGTPVIGDRMLPHSIWVNRDGRRFVNEGGQNAANSFYGRDSAGRLANLPCFNILDAQYRRKYPVQMSLSPRDDDPPWLARAESPEKLAELLGIDARGFQETLARFNYFARQGKDPDFQRGEGGYEHYFGDPDTPHRNLGTVERPPFYAFRVQPSSVGTKGGPLTNSCGQVVRESGEPIAGLYAAGNAAAAFNGPITVAAGCTLSPAIVMAYVGALHALGAESTAVSPCAVTS